MKRVVVVVAAAALTLTACGSSGKSNAASPPSKPMSASPTAWTLAEAQTNMKAFGQTFGTTMQSVGSAISNGKTTADRDHGCASAASTLDAASHALTAGKWPSNASADISTLVSALSTGKGLYARCATFTDADWSNRSNPILPQMTQWATSVQQAAQRLAVDLGIKPAGGAN
ncbi:MAG TPA: hypothetical protein VN108_07970 [Marmoricola sp.]|nr:hypothetical protein [Marmoricola sp.]